jgi:hypothetical protein
MWEVSSAAAVQPASKAMVAKEESITAPVFFNQTPN